MKYLVSPHVPSSRNYYMNTSFYEKSVIEPPVSSCCSASIDLDTLFCGRCGDHSDWVEVEYEPEWTEAEQFTLWSE